MEVVGKILEKTFKSQPGVAEFISMREVGLSPIPAIYREDATPKNPLNRSGEGSKLGGDSKATSADEILNVHGAPTTIQEK